VSPLTAKFAGGDANQAPHEPGQVALISKPNPGGNLANGQVAMQKQQPCPLNTLDNEILMRRETRRLLEEQTELRRAENLCKNLLLLAIKAYGTLLPERLKRCTMEASRTSLALA